MFVRDVCVFILNLGFRGLMLGGQIWKAKDDDYTTPVFVMAYSIVYRLVT